MSQAPTSKAASLSPALERYWHQMIRSCLQAGIDDVGIMVEQMLKTLYNEKAKEMARVEHAIGQVQFFRRQVAAALAAVESYTHAEQEPQVALPAPFYGVRIAFTLQQDTSAPHEAATVQRPLAEPLKTYGDLHRYLAGLRRSDEAAARLEDKHMLTVTHWSRSVSETLRNLTGPLLVSARSYLESLAAGQAELGAAPALAAASSQAFALLQQQKQKGQSGQRTARAQRPVQAFSLRRYLSVVWRTWRMRWAMWRDPRA